MKKLVFYLTIFSIAATALYYGSYHFFYPEHTDTEPDPEHLLAAMQEQDAVVQKNTTVIMEYYDKKTDRTTYEKLTGYAEILGYNRDQVVQYTKDYMKNMDVEDEAKGLYAFTLKAFAGDEITLQKSYDTPEVTQEVPAFYVGLLDHMIVIYKNDAFSTVYEVTDIDSRLLPPDIAGQLSDGMYFDDEYELYNFLEAYSS